MNQEQRIENLEECVRILCDTIFSMTKVMEQTFEQTTIPLAKEIDQIKMLVGLKRTGLE